MQNKRLSKGKKGIKKKVVDPFTRKGTFASYLHPARVLKSHSRLVRHQGSLDIREAECWQDACEPVAGSQYVVLYMLISCILTSV